MAKSGNEILGKGEYAWFLLENIEDSSMEIADIVQLRDDPPHDHLGVFSRRMALKLYEIGTVAEGIFKEILDDPSIGGLKTVDSKLLERARSREFPFPDIRDFRKVLEPVFNLSRRSVVFRYFTFTKTIKPFSTFAQSDGISPAWWVAYNQVKHDLFKNIEEATLGRLLEGAAGVFLLTVLCRSYWPALILNHKIIVGRVIASMYQNVDIDTSILYRELHEVLFPDSEIVPHQKVTVGLRQGNFLANSRLFFCALAELGNDNHYRIP